MSKRKLARAFAIFGITLLIAGLAFIQFWVNSDSDSSQLLTVWALIQGSSYVLSLIGFIGLFNLNHQFLRANGKTLKSPRTWFTQASLLSVIFGLALTFPLVQIGFPVPIATVFVAGGISLMGLSIILGLISLLFPKTRADS